MNRRQFTGMQVIGMACVLLGLAGLGYQAIPRSHAIPSVPLSQLGLATDHSERANIVASSLPKFVVAGADGQDNSSKNVRLWDAMLKVRGAHLPNIPQEIGDCVSWGAAHAVDYLQAVQMVRGPPGAFEFKEAYPPFIYGVSRVNVGQKHGSRFNGDGSVGAYAAEGLRDYGVLRSDAKDVPPYSGSIARMWGNHGPPKWALEDAKNSLVKTIAQVNSADEARDAICNGYPVTIASGWWGTTSITPKDGRMVARRNTSWAHQQCLIGYDGSGPRKYFYCLNSWGDKAHPAPLQGEPPGGYWIEWNDVHRITQEGDSWALSGFDGFPAEQIDWDDLLKRQTPVMSMGGPDSVSTERNEEIMIGSTLVLMLCLIGVGLLLFFSGVIARRRVAALSLLILMGSQFACAGDQPNFELASTRSSFLVTAYDNPPVWGAAMVRIQKPVEPITESCWETAVIRPEVQVVTTQPKRKAPQALVFTANWCDPCRSFKKFLTVDLKPLGWTAGEDQNSDFLLVNVDENRELQDQFKVETIPTVIYLDKDGVEFDRIVGFTNKRPYTKPLIDKR